LAYLKQEDVLYEAWCKVKANRGTGGVDEETTEDIVERGEHRFIGKIQYLLSSKRYKPNWVKRVYIPKRDGRKRPLGIPTVIDRVVQAAVRIVIEPIFEAGFEDCSYGFRPKRSARQACAEIYKLLNFGCEQVIDADLKSYFETIPHQRLMRLIAEKICDGNILKLIRGWANYYVHTNAGKSFGLVQKFVNKRIRRFLRRRRHKKGMGYRQYPDEFLYKRLGLLRINSGFLHYA
jgi:RNA-directed DNA polymerase